jgi:hypothetical protein
MWLDRRLGTVCVFTIFGFTGGMAYGLWELIRMTRTPTGKGDGEDNGREGSQQ